MLEKTTLQTYSAAPAFLSPVSELNEDHGADKNLLSKGLGANGLVTIEDELNYANNLAFTADGTYLASGSITGAVRLWNVSAQSVPDKLEVAFTEKIGCVAISPDGTMIAAGSDDCTVAVWKIVSKTVQHILNGHSGWINSVAFSPDGKTLATGSMDESVILWNVETGYNLRRIDKQLNCVNAVTFSPNGSRLAIASIDCLVRLWDVHEDSEVPRQTLNGHTGCVNAVAFSSTGKRIISGSDDMTIKLWHTSTGVDQFTLKGHGKKVTSVTFSLTTSLVVSESEDTTVKVCDASTGSLLHTIQAHTSGVNSIVFSQNGRLLASASFDDRVRLWLTDTWELHAELKHLPYNDVKVSSHLNVLTGGATRSHPVSFVDLTRSPNPDLSESGLHIPPSIFDSIGRGTDAYPSTMPTSYGLVNPHDKTALQTN
jgi:WD40 repeat protein